VNKPARNPVARLLIPFFINSFMELTTDDTTKRAHQEKIQQVFHEVGKVVVGQQYMVNRLLIGLFTNGHILLEGVPGLAKTLTVNTLAKVLHLDFKRIQFTPDLLPADLIGTMIYNQQRGDFEVKKGPIFSNLILADEVNRSPAKVQSALLESMQEKQVTIGETTYPLDRPFLVLATQNPVDQEGTYPLPEAQVDRFMLKVHVDYPSKENELEVMRRMANMSFSSAVESVLTKEDIFAIRDEINAVAISDSLEKYIIELVFATRDPKNYGLSDVEPYIQFGVSPRASINLNIAAKAVAFFDQRDYVLPEDIKEVAHDVFNHRILLNYEAEADGVRTGEIIEKILRKVPINQ
jgi:MoxR-like ATPase